MFDIEKLGTRTNFESIARHGLKKFSFLESSFFVSLSDYKSIKKESAGTWSTINTKRKIAKLFIQTKCSWQVLSNLTFHWWSAIFKCGVRLVMLFFIVSFPVVFTNSWRAKTEKKIRVGLPFGIQQELAEVLKKSSFWPWWQNFSKFPISSENGMYKKVFA